MARIIHTAGELDALPTGARIRTLGSIRLELTKDPGDPRGDWWAPRSEIPWPTAELTDPRALFGDAGPFEVVWPPPL